MTIRIPDRYMKPVRIAGVGMGVPNEIRYNRSFLRGTSWSRVADIFARCGIECRHVLSGEETTATIATEAADQALNMAGMSAMDVDLILTANTLPDDYAYGISSIVQNELGARKAAVIDVRAACTGFVKGLEVATSFIETNTYSNILVIGAETPSRIYQEKPDVAILFGDGAGAMVLTPSTILKPWVFHMSDDGSLWHLMQRRVTGPDTNVHFDGRMVFYHAVKTMVQDAKDVMEKAHVSLQDIDKILLHQANIRIIKAAAASLGLVDRLGRLNRKVPTNILRYGNTSSASIPILITELVRKGRLKEGFLILLIAFGAGLTSGALITEW